MTETDSSSYAHLHLVVDGLPTALFSGDLFDPETVLRVPERFDYLKHKLVMDLPLLYDPHLELLYNFQLTYLHKNMIWLRQDSKFTVTNQINPTKSLHHLYQAL